MSANPARGEAALTVDGRTYRFRPSFEALVAAEAELGPLFALVERAADGKIMLQELAGLFWHCLAEEAPPERAVLADALVAAGLAALTPVLRRLLGQILQGR